MICIVVVVVVADAVAVAVAAAHLHLLNRGDWRPLLHLLQGDGMPTYVFQVLIIINLIYILRFFYNHTIILLLL